MEEIVLSVSMPNYNHGSYLLKRIPSLLDAMPHNAELIIVDDGSTDNSVEIIEQFAVLDKRIIFIRHEKNKGVIAALNQILAIARGKFISFQSSDDHIFPHFFSTMLKTAQDYPNYAIYCSNFGFCQDFIPKDLSTVKFHQLLSNIDTKKIASTHKPEVKTPRKRGFTSISWAF